MISTPSKAMAKLYRSRAGRIAWWLWLIILAIGTAMLAFAVLVFGRVSGIEVSNQDLTTRDFYYWQIPIAQIQVSPVYRQQTYSCASETEIASHLKPLQPGIKPQWDLVYFTDVATEWKSQSDGAILVQYLSLAEADKFFWVEWSKSHPTRAKELWPAIQDLALNKLYAGMPRLFELYRHGESDSSLAPERDEAMTELAKFYIEDLIARKDLDSAKKIASMAGPYDTQGQLKSFDHLLVNSAYSDTSASNVANEASNDTGTKESGTKESGTKESGTKESGTKESGTKDTGTKESGTKESEKK